MKPEHRNRIILAVSLLVAGGGLAFISMGKLGQNLVYYWSPSETVAKGDKAYGATIRLGGVVQPASLQWDAAKTELRFRVADNHTPGAPSVAVIARETPPQMFREGIGVVVEGTYEKSHVFTARRLMVNHSNEYRPPKDGEKPRLDTLEDEAATAAKGP
jgi:cytochrome c-type biogenesis protein CcmE